MRQERTRIVTTIIAALATASGGAFAYTIVTRDGHMIEAQARPEIRGAQAIMRLAHGGQLAVIAEGKIDWQRTDARNPDTGPIAIPAATMMTERTAPKGTGKPIELKLYGGPTARVEPGTVVVPSQQPPKPNSGEAIINLQKEYAQVVASRDTEAASKSMMEQELAQLRARDVGYASESSSSQQRIRELTEKIASSSSRISMLENRINDIRSEVVQLGGVVD